MKDMKKWLPILFTVLVLWMAPTIVLAQTKPAPAPTNVLFDRSGIEHPVFMLPNLSTIFGSGDANGLPDQIFNFVIDLLALIGGLAAFFYILYGGFTYLMAGGDASKTDRARKMIFGAVIGIMIMALSFLLLQYVRVQIINALK